MQDAGYRIRKFQIPMSKFQINSEKQFRKIQKKKQEDSAYFLI
jgi:hypothetical protein